MRQITVLEAVHQARRTIGDIDARMLLQHVLDMSHAVLIAHSDRELLPEQAQYFVQLAQRRAHGEPVAYLTGKREFYSLDFKVSPAVLIPRPETELLVDLALERSPVDCLLKILDLGTGSGAIALTIAKYRPLASVTAVDASNDAVAIAKSNAKQLGVSNVNIIRSNWFDRLVGERFDLIVSNPPYVAGADPHLAQGDLRFEPSMALTDSGDGLSCLRTIIAAAPAHLETGGTLLVEHGYDQAQTCRLLLEEAGFGAIICRPDLAGIARISGGICMI
ncbi:peptide chain release factor N(5)-glutamine methyltransferase [Nitrosovibrio tenuis]|uniref:Release factor glutamine methyltransferase n=1 Tax=Nitrosovibrio tenuis TaxID=1233 RepID=A0A1H7R6K6_9PROT|nr:peptide chain release factor N(5)-glutamine methyltransferase [Nitrosovibrio tenuis]SEL55833.1 [protein release factor]-glutamine N5-methyltransferase [Nitrosovibrio tenuis]